MSPSFPPPSVICQWLISPSISYLPGVGSCCCQLKADVICVYLVMYNPFSFLKKKKKKLNPPVHTLFSLSLFLSRGWCTTDAEIQGCLLRMVVAFLLACENFLENVRQFIPCLRFTYLFIFEVGISSLTLTSLFRPESVHCGRMFPDKLRVSLFPDRFPQYARSAA